MSAALDRETLAKVTAFVERGGLLLRFAGSRLAAAGNDDLVPVRLRRGGRSLGGTLSWDTPRTFAPFTRESPFFGLAMPGRDRHPSPDPGRARQRPRRRRPGRRSSTARPIVTADKRGNGPHRPLPCHRRHDLVEPAALGPLRRHAAAHHGARRHAGRHRRRGPQRRHADDRPAPDPRRVRHLRLAAGECPRRAPQLCRTRDGRASARLLRPGRLEPRRQLPGVRRQACADRLRAAQGTGRAPCGRQNDRSRAPLFTPRWCCS